MALSGAAKGTAPTARSVARPIRSPRCPRRMPAPRATGRGQSPRQPGQRGRGIASAPATAGSARSTATSPSPPATNSSVIAPALRAPADQPIAATSMKGYGYSPSHAPRSADHARYASGNASHATASRQRSAQWGAASGQQPPAQVQRRRGGVQAAVRPPLPALRLPQIAQHGDIDAAGDRDVQQRCGPGDPRRGEPPAHASESPRQRDRDHQQVGEDGEIAEEPQRGQPWAHAIVFEPQQQPVLQQQRRGGHRGHQQRAGTHGGGRGANGVDGVAPVAIGRARPRHALDA